MLQLKIKPVLYKFETCREFADEFQVGEGDLILTNQYIYEPCFGKMNLNADVIYQEKYGSGEPSDEMIEAIYQDVKKLHTKRIIAIGGGTVLDIAKIFALKNVSPLLDLIDGRLDVVKEKEFLAVPTTCGTGSEVTCLAAVELKSRGTKIGFGVEEMFADAAVLIPELLKGLPLKFFAASSIDAFIHAIESYLSPKATSYTELYSMEAMRLILNGYQQIFTEGPEARLALLGDFLTASNYAGIAFGNAGCAAVHAMSYPLGGNYHVPHGESNYAMFSGVFRTYMKKDPQGKIADLNRMLSGWLSCNPDQVYDRIEELFDYVLPRKALHEYGMTENDCALFADIVVEKQVRLTNNNYTELTREDYLNIYRELY
ncbi:4-hydroxybutyrate dehydrogenase [Anaerolentibacter hominis]|uniref:4-hydroxybutyrate dehydrogenase n=1 Tax=Anaerolentibacter hominis TaxID=3079009 RepID=UPI0031B84A51